MKQPVDLSLRERIVDHLSEIPFKDLRALACWIGLPLAGMFSLYVAFCVVCTTIHNRAEYAGFRLEGTYDEFWSGSVGSYGGSGKPSSESELFLKFPEHDPVSIHEVTPEYLEKNFPIKVPRMVGSMELGISDEGGKFFTRRISEATVTYTGFGLEMRFEQEGLNVVVISCTNLSYGKGVTCSNRRDGQYISLPIPCGELYKAWGEPDSTKRSRDVNGFHVH